MSTQEASLVGPRGSASRRQPARGLGVLRRLDAGELGRHLDRLYRAAWALSGSREDAEDPFQEAYARVLARPRFLRSEDDLGYLLADSPPGGGCRNARGLALPAPYVPVVAADTRTAITPLPPDFRDALVAVDVVGLSYREAAAQLGVKAATLTTRLHRARVRVIAERGPAGSNRCAAVSNGDGDARPATHQVY